MHDLTDYLQPALAHYKRLALDFDCIYTGFLASSEQIDRWPRIFRGVSRRARGWSTR